MPRSLRLISPGLGSGVQAIAAGGAHTGALAGGNVRCWGGNFNGAFGNNSTTDSLILATPVKFW